MMSSSVDNDETHLALHSAMTTTNNVGLPSRDERDRAVQEAQACLEAVNNSEAGSFQLDGFNLLGVVANPRSGGTYSSSTHGASDSTTQQPQHQSSSSTTQTVMRGISSEDQPEQAPGIFSDAVQTFESTLAQVTVQIESLNVYLEDLSRQYLGNDADESLYLEYYYQTEEEDQTHPLHMMRQNIPPELVNLELQDLQHYLEECGVLAHTLVAQTLTTRTLEEEDVVDEDQLHRQLEDIPSVFYEAEFDLTDARTFADLLLRQDENDAMDGITASSEIDDVSDTTAQKTKAKASNSLYQPTQELVPVREQDFLAGHLDRVELALQEQVRQKSTAFFHETTRFRQLQSGIEELLQQVQLLRASLQQALSVYQQTKDISDHQRQDYEILIDLLDGSMELIRCKASIGGLLSANDHLGAALQIQYGRKLLTGCTDGNLETTTQTKNANVGTTNENGTSATNDDDNAETTTSHHLELRLINALSTAENQFGQYESLVVQSLSEELVEIFFHWKPSEKERVQETVEALQICKALDKTSELYQRRLQQMVRMTVRTTIAEYVESSTSTSATSASNYTNGSSGGVTGMTYPAFYNCLKLLMEEIQSILAMANRVDDFCAAEAIFGEESLSAGDNTNGSQRDQQRWTKEAVVQGAELATKSIAELLRLRKEAHSVISLGEMKQLWDTCMEFTAKMEGYNNNQTRAVGLRSTLAGQAKAFLDRTHESNMSALVASLDSERWGQCEVSYERQAALTRLCTGLATVSTPLRNLQENGVDKNTQVKKPMAVVEGVNYKVVWSCLLLMEMIMTNLSSAAYFQQSLATNAVTKVVELMRLFNSRTTNLVLGAGAIHSAARLKSINAKHLSYVTQCLGMTIALLPHIRAALMAQLPPKQHALLADLDSIKNEYKEHNEKVLNKFVSIIGGIVEHGLAPRIAGTDFDERAKKTLTSGNNGSDATVECFVFLDGISSSTRKLHHVLNALLPPDHLQDVFSRIFAHVDQQIPALLIATASTAAFSFPSTDAGKHRLLLEVGETTRTLNGLGGVLPWDFTSINVLERKLDYKLPIEVSSSTVISTSASNEVEPASTDGQVTHSATTLNGEVVTDSEAGDGVLEATSAPEQQEPGNVQEREIGASDDSVGETITTTSASTVGEHDLQPPTASNGAAATNGGTVTTKDSDVTEAIADSKVSVTVNGDSPEHQTGNQHKEIDSIPDNVVNNQVEE